MHIQFVIHSDCINLCTVTQASCGCQQEIQCWFRPRNPWQSISEDMHQYVMSAPVFSRKSAFNSVDDPLLYKLHPRIATVLEEDKKLVANPKKPSILAYKHDELCQVEDSHMGPLQKGDIVWVSFTLSYAIGCKDWCPEVKPMEIIHVGRLADFPALWSDIYI